MNLKILYITLGILSTELLAAQNQTMEMSLEQVVKIARLESPDARTARHSFRSAYWNYKYYRANYLPSLSLSSDPNLNRAINKITMGDGSVKFVEQNLLNTDLTLNLSQNIPWTGGSLFLETSAQRMDLFSEHKYSWQTSPVMIGYRQSLFGYNSLKWDKRIEPVRYQEAKKSYVETLELVSANAINKFFALATAQSNYDIASFNYANADTLYRYAQGRYNIGTITENEMLQLELNRLTEETNRMNARIEMDNCMQELRSYLGIQEDRELRVRINSQGPDFRVNLDEALALAYENSPDIQAMKRRKLESESAVARARANAGLKADIYLRFGLTQTAEKLPDAYRNLLDQQYVSLSIALPILDWGKGRGRVRLAKSQQELIKAQIEQSQMNFERDVTLSVNQFQDQTRLLDIAVLADSVAQCRYKTAYNIFVMGNINVLDINSAQVERDNARREYISQLYTSWLYYYNIRQLSLYDFVRDEDIIYEMIKN